jgi:hypothetical protein
MDISVISTGVQTQKMGGNPLVNNPGDRFRRQVPYPRIWVYLFSWLRITASRIPIVGVTFCVLYLICISWLILHCPGVIGPVLLMIAGLSLASLLAIERGNIDLFIFFLLFLGCAATSRFLRIAAFFAATALKIYPIAALGVEAIRRPLKNAALPIAATVSAAALLALQWRDIEAIRHTAPIVTFLSFGTLSLFAQAKFLSW